MAEDLTRTQSGGEGQTEQIVKPEAPKTDEYKPIKVSNTEPQDVPLEENVVNENTEEKEKNTLSNNLEEPDVEPESPLLREGDVPVQGLENEEESLSSDLTFFNDLNQPKNPDFYVEEEDPYLKYNFGDSTLAKSIKQDINDEETFESLNNANQNVNLNLDFNINDPFSDLSDEEDDDVLIDAYFNKPLNSETPNPESADIDPELPVPPKRDGFMKNEDGTVSSHKMRAEQLEDGSWVAFPSLFQNEDGSWVDMSKEAEVNWLNTYKEAEKRGEVIPFGDDKQAALDYGEGNWKGDDYISNQIIQSNEETEEQNVFSDKTEEELNTLLGELTEEDKIAKEKQKDDYIAYLAKITNKTIENLKKSKEVEKYDQSETNIKKKIKNITNIQNPFFYSKSIDSNKINEKGLFKKKVWINPFPALASKNSRETMISLGNGDIKRGKLLMRVFKDFFITERELERFKKKSPKATDRSYINSKYQDLIESFNITPTEFSSLLGIMDRAMAWKNDSKEGVKKTVKLPSGNLHKFAYKPWGQDFEFNIDPDKYKSTSVTDFERVSIPFTFDLAWRRLQVSNTQLALIKRAYNKKGKPFNIKTFKKQRMLALAIDKNGDAYYVAEGGIYNHGLTGSSNKKFRDAYKRYKRDKAKERIDFFGETGDGKGTKRSNSERLKVYGTEKEIPWADASSIDEIEKIARGLGVKDTRLGKNEINNRVQKLLFPKNGEISSEAYVAKNLSKLFPGFTIRGYEENAFLSDDYQKIMSQGNVTDLIVESPTGVTYSFDDLQENYKDGNIQSWFFNNQNSHLDNIKEEWNKRYDTKAYNMGLASKASTDYIRITTNVVKRKIETRQFNTEGEYLKLDETQTAPYPWEDKDFSIFKKKKSKFVKKEGASIIVGPDGRNQDIVNDMLKESLDNFDSKTKRATFLNNEWEEISKEASSKFKKAKTAYNKNRKYYKARRDAILMDIDQNKVSMLEGKDLIDKLNSDLNSSANEYKNSANQYQGLIKENSSLISEMNETQDWLNANQSSLYKNMKNFENTVAFNKSVRENTATDNVFSTILSGALEGIADVYEAIAVFTTDLIVLGVKITENWDKKGNDKRITEKDAQKIIKDYATSGDTRVMQKLLNITDGDPRTIQAQTTEISRSLADMAGVKILPEGLAKMNELYQGFFAVSQSAAAMLVPIPFAKGTRLTRTTKGGRRIIQLANGEKKFFSELPFRQRASINLRTKMHLNFNMSAMMYSGYRSEIENDPELSKMSAAQKNFFAIPTSIVVGALENLGMKSMNLLKGGSTNFLKTVFNNALKQGPKTSRQFHNLLLSETEKLYLNITSKALTPLLAEGITEAAQVIPEVGMRSIWNNYVLDSHLFSNPDTAEELAGMMYQNFKLGMYGATGMSSVTGGVNFMLTQMRGAKSDYTFSQEDYDILSVELNRGEGDGKSLKQYYASLYQANEISREEALNRIKSINKFIEVESNIDALGDNFSKEQRKELVDLYVKKIAVQAAYEKSKDVNLSSIISLIDKQIMSISQGDQEVDAEQETGVEQEEKTEELNVGKTRNRKDLSKKEELNEVTSKMKELAPQYKKAEGKEKENILNDLKELTAKKKKLEYDVIQEQINVIDESINPEKGSKPSGLELEVLEEEKQNLIKKRDNLTGGQNIENDVTPVEVVNEDGDAEVIEGEEDITIEEEGPKRKKQKIFSEVLGREVEREVYVDPEEKSDEKTTTETVASESKNVSTKINQEKSEQLGGEARDIIVDGKVVGTVMGNENASGDFEVQDVDVDESLQGQGIGTQVYEQLNKEKKGQKVVSSGAFVENEAGVKPGEKLWNKLVEEGKAVKNENGNFEMISEEDQKKSTTEKVPVTGKSDEKTTTQTVEEQSENKQEAPVKKLSTKELEETGKVEKGKTLTFVDPQDPNKKIRLKVKQTGKTNKTTVKFERNKNLKNSDIWYAYSEKDGKYVAIDKATGKAIQSLELAPIKPKAEKTTKETTKVKGKRGRKAKTAEQLIEERTNLEKELNDIRPINPETGKRKAGRLTGKAKERQIEINKRLDSIEGLLEKRAKEEKTTKEQVEEKSKKDMEEKLRKRLKSDKDREGKLRKRLKEDEEKSKKDREEKLRKRLKADKNREEKLRKRLKADKEKSKKDREEKLRKKLESDKNREDKLRKKLEEEDSTKKESKTPVKEEKTPAKKDISGGELTIEGVGPKGFDTFVGESYQKRRGPKESPLGDTRKVTKDFQLYETIVDGKKVFTLQQFTLDRQGRPAHYNISLAFPADSDITIGDVSGELLGINRDIKNSVKTNEKNPNLLSLLGGAKRRLEAIVENRKQSKSEEKTPVKKKSNFDKTIDFLDGMKSKNWTGGDGGAALSTIPGLAQAFDLAIETVKTAIKGGKKVADLSKAVMTEFKNTKYYKNLPKGTKRDHVRKVKNLLDERQKQIEREAQTKERKRVEKRDKKRDTRKRFRGTTYDREEGDGVEGKRQKSEGTKRRNKKKSKVTSKNLDGMLDPEAYTDEVYIQDKIDEALENKDDSEEITTTEKAQYIMLLKNHEIGAEAGSKEERRVIKNLQNSLVKLTNSLFSDLKITNRERARLIKKIKNANTKKQYDKAVREVENLAKKIIQKEVTKIITDPKTLRKKSNQKWNKGKVSSKFRDAFNKFVSNLDPIEEMSLNEIIAVKNELKSIIKDGKFDLEKINREKKRRRRRTDGTLIQAIKKPLKILNDIAGVLDFFNYEGTSEQGGVKAGSGVQRVIVINGEYMTKTEFQEALKNGEITQWVRNEENTAWEELGPNEKIQDDGRSYLMMTDDGSPVLNIKGYEKSDSSSKTSQQKIRGSLIKRLGRGLLSISAAVRGIEQIHNKIINKTLSEDIRKTLRAFGNNLSLAPKRILDISNDKTNLFNQKMREALGFDSDSDTKGKKIFGKDSYKEFLDGLSDAIIGSGKSLFLKKENGESFMDRDITKSEIVQIYLLSKNGENVRNTLISKDGIDLQAIEEFMNENKDLKIYADAIIDFMNSDMKEFIEPVYQYYFDLGVPNMDSGDFYYPISRDITDQDNSGTLYESLKKDAASNGTDGNIKSQIGNAITSPLNERVTNANAKINWEMKSPHAVVAQYIEDVARADVMRETVEQASSILNPFYQNELQTILGKNIYEDYRELISRIVSGKNMFKDQDRFHKGIDVLINITAVKTLAFRTKAIIQQAASTINYTGAGIKHGVNPLEIWGVRYKGDEKGVKVFSDNYKKVSARIWNSAYRKYRTSQGGGQEIEVKRMLDKIAAAGDVSMFRKAINHYVKIGMLPIAVGDILAASYMPGGGFSFATALYEKAIRDGKSEEQALQFAEDQWYRETESAQQYSLDETLKSRLTYNKLHRLLIPFSSSQRSYVGKWVRARQVLTGAAYGTYKGKNPYTKEEVHQAAWDIWFYPLFSNATFTAVSGGYAYYYLKDAIAAALGDDEDDWVDDSAEKHFMDRNGYIKLGNKKLKYIDGKWYNSKGDEIPVSLGDKESLSRRMKYFLAMETIQSSIQGIGVPGTLSNLAINWARGRFQTSSGNPTVDLVKDLASGGGNVLFSDQGTFTKTKDWSLLSKRERQQFEEMGITKEEFNKPMSNMDALPFLSWDKLTQNQKRNWGDLAEAIGLKNILKLVGMHPSQNDPGSIAKEQSFIEETVMGTLPLTDKNSFMYMQPDKLFQYFYNEDPRLGLDQSGGIRAGTKKQTFTQEDKEMVFDENTGVSRPKTEEEMLESSKEKLNKEEAKGSRKKTRTNYKRKGFRRKRKKGRRR